MASCRGKFTVILVFFIPTSFPSCHLLKKGLGQFSMTWFCYIWERKFIRGRKVLEQRSRNLPTARQTRRSVKNVNSEDDTKSLEETNSPIHFSNRCWNFYCLDLIRGFLQNSDRLEDRDCIWKVRLFNANWALVQATWRTLKELTGHIVIGEHINEFMRCLYGLEAWWRILLWQIFKYFFYTHQDVFLRC